MGKHKVVIDVGTFNTKIAVFDSKKERLELLRGAIFNTPTEGINEEFIQKCNMFLAKLDVKGSELYTVFSEDSENSFQVEKELPLGNKKEIDGILANSFQSITQCDPSLYYHSWRLEKTLGSTGQAKIKIAVTKKDYVDRIYGIAEKNKIKSYSRADLGLNAVEGLALLLQRKGVFQEKPSNAANVVLEIGNRTAKLVIFTVTEIIRSEILPHHLHRLDAILQDEKKAGEGEQDVNPELLKMDPKLVLHLKQYQNFLLSLVSELTCVMIQAVNGYRKYELNGLYFTGALFKVPGLVQTVNQKLDVPCFEYPLSSFLEVRENCIYRNSQKLYPANETFSTSLGAIARGDF